eukprot:750079-Hanusia_phi.AAC.5
MALKHFSEGNANPDRSLCSFVLCLLLHHHHHQLLLSSSSSSSSSPPPPPPLPLPHPHPHPLPHLLPLPLPLPLPFLPPLPSFSSARSASQLLLSSGRCSASPATSRACAEDGEGSSSRADLTCCRQESKMRGQLEQSVWQVRGGESSAEEQRMGEQRRGVRTGREWAGA